jgi:hypothetical protein
MIPTPDQDIKQGLRFLHRIKKENKAKDSYTGPRKNKA